MKFEKIKLGITPKSVTYTTRATIEKTPLFKRGIGARKIFQNIYAFNEYGDKIKKFCTVEAITKAHYNQGNLVSVQKDKVVTYVNKKQCEVMIGSLDFENVFKDDTLYIVVLKVTNDSIGGGVNEVTVYFEENGIKVE